MASWSRRRRALYASIVIVVLIVAVGVPAFLTFYKAPTCSDGKQNGSEQGVDCGGACQRLCPSAFLPPAVSWIRFVETAPGLYNVAAYVVNPNADVEAPATPYKITLYDKDAAPLETVAGTIDIPARRNTLAFQRAVKVDTQVPIRASFEFSAPPEWKHAADKSLDAVTVVDQRYVDDPDGSSLQVTLSNSAATPTGRIAVGVVLKDADQNAIDFSRTVIDSIPARGTAAAPYTWPTSHDSRVVSIEVLPVAE